jgi:mannose/fructose/N-acetylgalactosamine-specific phosphotransferase system component IIB
LCDTDIHDILKLSEENGVNIELKQVPRERAVNIKEAIKKYCQITP